jgi:signal transduction histidine kinase
MRLTWKLSLALAIGVLLVLAGYGVVRVRVNILRFREDVGLEHASLALAVAASIEAVAAREGEARAIELVEQIDRSQPRSRIAWRRDTTGTERAVVTHTFDEESSPERLVSRLGVRVDGHDAGVVEIVEPLERETELEHELVVRVIATSAVVLAICVLLILGLGAHFVGRPLDALRAYARRIGAGERGVTVAIDSADEIGDLGREMNAMAKSLDAAAERTQREEVTRLGMLAQLRHADRLRAVGEMAASIAHDLGTPMSTVSARAQMIASGEVDTARSRELGSLIVAEVERMSGSIRGLLDHARRDPLRLEATDAGRLARDVVGLLRPISHARRVTVRVDGGDDAAATAALDAGLMRHVLVNLITNAIDASPDGGTVEVSVETDAHELVVEVADRGPGIAADRLETIFEPFFTTKASGAGTGLGLSVARGIVEEHGGTLVASSREGGGGLFVVRVPLGVGTDGR